jgi:hypothetical protein
MPRATTDRLTLNPPLGRMPVLQFMAPAELAVDPAYQRSTESGESRALIKRIAQHWDWGQCQTLSVARRGDGSLFVIDGQHRLEAARLRGDIAQLPCVIADYPSAADEAAAFVRLNSERRALTALDLFRAAVSSGDSAALAIAQAIAEAGLALAPHGNATVWKPGMIGNIGGIRKAWKRHGAAATGEALKVLAAAFEGEAQHYAGTLFSGVVAVCAAECKSGEFDCGRFAPFTAKLATRGQASLREDVLLEMASEPGLGRELAAQRVITELWWPERRKDREAIARALTAQGVAPGVKPQVVVFKADESGLAWCAQCDARVSQDKAARCASRYCSLRKSA